ncbi:hypothetical protein AAG906_030520 [Vitis piasezkii]
MRIARFVGKLEKERQMISQVKNLRHTFKFVVGAGIVGGKGDGARGYNAVILKQPEVVAKVTHQNPQKHRHSIFPVWLFVLTLKMTASRTPNYPNNYNYFFFLNNFGKRASTAVQMCDDSVVWAGSGREDF